VIGWEDYSRDICHVEGFPYKNQFEELFIAMVLYLFPKRNIVNLLINFT